MKFRKLMLAPFLLVVLFSLNACSGGSKASNNIFPNIDNASIPDVLEKTVGTVGDTYFSSGITDAPDYKTILVVTFKNTTKEDYDVLMEHYQSASTGTDESGALLYDWGRLQVSSKDNSITINALLQK